METLEIKGTDETPAVIFDQKHGIFEISGRSLIEDTASFYEPVFKWLEKYREAPNEATQFVFKLDYANTASIKFIQDILTFLENIPNVTVSWYFLEEDEDMEDTGKEFAELVEVPFEFIHY